MTIVEYELNLSEPTIPVYVTDGGYWMNPDGSEKMIGVGIEGSIPDSVETFTLEELQARQRVIHAEHPMVKSSKEIDRYLLEDLVELTDDEVNDVIKEWWDAKS